MNTTRYSHPDRLDKYVISLTHNFVGTTRVKGPVQQVFESGCYVGVDAFTVASAPEAGEYGEPVFHARLGQVWQDQ